jgi:hypothetical protein
VFGLMKRKSTRTAVVGLMLLYLFGASCFSIVAPRTAIASTVGDCSDTNASSAMFPCEHPSFSCRSAATDKNGIVSSIQSGDPSRSGERAVTIIAVIRPPDSVAPSFANSSHAIPFGPSQKIPIHILKSVLSI